MLGEKFSASIEAKYYFGAPVTEAKVKYKVLRTSYSADWYPAGRLGLVLRAGLLVVRLRLHLVSGLARLGLPAAGLRLVAAFRRPERPELVAEVEAAIGKDGVVKVEIDTALAKEIHGDTDHKYEITAEVTDPSRRTIVGTGSVLVARKPFKVYAWVDRGHYRVGDVVHANFMAQTLDNKPVQGAGRAAAAAHHLRQGRQAGRDGSPEMEARHRRAGPRRSADQGREGRTVSPQLQGDRLRSSTPSRAATSSASWAKASRRATSASTTSSW